MYLYDKKLLEKCSCLICHKLVTATGLNQHYFKSHTEEGQLLVKNSRDKLKSYYSNLKDITTQKKKLILRIEQYNLNPKLCQLCQKPIEYRKKNKFCSSSCAAQVNNQQRPAKHPSRKSNTRSQTLKTFYQDKNQFCKISWCKVCKSIIKNSWRKCCSSKCLKLEQSRSGHYGGLKSSSIQITRSKDEIKLFELCSANFKNVKHNIPIVDGWDADIILEDYKVAILWNGPWHYKQMPHRNHSLLQVQTRDRIKIEALEKLGWNVIIFEDRFYTPKTAFNELISKFLVAGEGIEPSKGEL